MNKKFLIGGALLTALLVTACVKKEAPKDEDNEQTVENTQQVEQIEDIEISTPEIEPEPPTQIEVVRQETNNTSATIRREYRDAPTESTPSSVERPTPTPSNTSSGSQSEDDAVAAAIAAATPALDN